MVLISLLYILYFMEKFKHNDFAVISDFDGTLTQSYNQEGEKISLTSILRNKKYNKTDSYVMESVLNYQKQASSVDSEIFLESSLEHINIIKKHLNKSLLDNIDFGSIVRFRPGVKDFLMNCSENDIPIHIISATLFGDIVKRLFIEEDLFFNNVTFSLNEFNYVGDRISSLKNNSIITPYNKNTVIYKKVNSGFFMPSNLLLLGNVVADSNMADLLDCNSVHKVCFKDESEAWGPNINLFFDQLISNGDFRLLNEKFDLLNI